MSEEVTSVLDEVCAHFGSASELAKTLGITPHAISMWRSRGQIPLSQSARIEVLTSGKYKARSLTPDAFQP